MKIALTVAIVFALSLTCMGRPNYGTKLDDNLLSMTVGSGYCNGEILLDPVPDCVGPKDGKSCEAQRLEVCVGGGSVNIKGVPLEIPRFCLPLPGGCKSGSYSSNCPEVKSDQGDKGTNGTAKNGTGIPCGNASKKLCKDVKTRAYQIPDCKEYYGLICIKWGAKDVTLPTLISFGCEDDPNPSPDTVSCGGNYTKYMGYCGPQPAVQPAVVNDKT